MGRSVARDGRLLFARPGSLDFSGHGLMSIVLYLVATGIGALEVGVLLTRTLVGDATISLC